MAAVPYPLLTRVYIEVARRLSKVLLTKLCEKLGKKRNAKTLCDHASERTVKKFVHPKCTTLNHAAAPGAAACN